MAPTAPLLQLTDFSLARDDRCLLAELKLCLNAGAVMQVVGANGAGKTSLLRVLAGLSDNYEGEFLYCDRPIEAVRFEFACDLLYLPHLPGIKKALTARENLAWYQAQSGGAGDLDYALAQVGLAGYEDLPAAQLSAGQLRRVALARLYLSQARIWILDEPFTAIDKRGVAELETLIFAHAAKGGAVLLTSHQDLSLPNLALVDLAPFQRAAQARDAWQFAREDDHV